MKETRWGLRAGLQARHDVELCVLEKNLTAPMYLPLPRPHEMSCSFMVIQNLLYHLLCILKNSHHVIAQS